MNDSLIEIALREMKAKRKPRTLAKIAKDVFEVKGISTKEADRVLSQFQIDFMLSGYFICCGEDKGGIKLWDLKNRQPSSLLDKDGNYLEDLYSDDEEVVKNELTEETVYKKSLEADFDNDYDNDEEEDEIVERDEIEEELLSEGAATTDEVEYDEDDAPIEDDYEDEDISDYEDTEEVAEEE